MGLMSPCKDCPNRFLGCHSVCEQYQEYCVALQEQKKRNQIDYGFENAKFRTISRYDRDRIAKRIGGRK